MPKPLLFALSIPLAAFAAQAGAASTHCEMRATRVVQQIEQDAGEPLPLAQSRLAYQAAVASCEADPAESAAETPVSEQVAVAEGSRFDRFVQGLLSLEPQNVKKRPGGKYRYLEKD